MAWVVCCDDDDDQLLMFCTLCVQVLNFSFLWCDVLLPSFYFILIVFALLQASTVR
jgi:hypothetical protein